MSLIQVIRNLPNVGDERRVRATFLAKIFAYRHTFTPCEQSFDEVYDEAVGAFKTCIQEVNETLYVDTHLAMGIFKDLLKARYEVACDECDPTLVRYVLSASTTTDQLNRDTRNTLSAVCGDDTFKRLCRDATSILNVGEE